MSRSHVHCPEPDDEPERYQVRQAEIARSDSRWSSAMITTSYTRLVFDCHREELSNRFHLVTNGYFASRTNVETPESYRVAPVAVVQPLAVGRDALDLKSSEVAGTA